MTTELPLTGWFIASSKEEPCRSRAENECHLTGRGPPCRPNIRVLSDRVCSGAPAPGRRLASRALPECPAVTRPWPWIRFSRGAVSPYKGARVKKALPRLAAGAGPLSSSGSFQAKPMTRAANRPLIASSTRDRLLIAASDRARASGSLDGYRPAAPVAPVIGIIVIPTITLTVAGLTNVN